MKISCVTSLYGNYSIWEAVRRIGTAGYEGIDIWGGRSHVYRRDYSYGELVSIRSLVEEYDLKVNSFLPAFFRYPHNLCHPNVVIRRDTLDYLYQSIDSSVVLGAELFLVCPGKIMFGQTAGEAWDFMSEGLHSVCEYASQYDGLKIVLEPVNKQVFDVINSAADAIRMIEQLNFSSLGIILDSGHINLEDESVQDAIRIAGKRLYQVHVNDNDGYQQQNLIPGEGTFDFSLFFKLLRENEFDGYVSAELGAAYASDPDSAIVKTRNRLRNFLG